MEKHFILEMIDLFPGGYSIEVENVNEKDRDDIIIILSGKDDTVPFRITGPVSEINTQLINEKVLELRESMNHVRTNKDEWISAQKAKIEAEAEKEASKVKSTATKKKTKTELDQEAKDKARAEYKELYGKDADQSLTLAALNKAIDVAKKADAKEKSLFDDEPQNKESDKEPEMANVNALIDDKSGNETEKVEEKSTIPEIPSSGESSEENVTVGNSNEDESPFINDNGNQDESNEEDENSILGLGSWITP